MEETNNVTRNIYYAFSSKAAKLRPLAEKECHDEAKRRGYKDWFDWWDKEAYYKWGEPDDFRMKILEKYSNQL